MELTQKALALDDTLPWAYAVLGWIYLYKQQPEQALAAAEQAIALQPNNADSYATQSEILRAAGRPEEALRSIEKAMRLNPRPPGQYLLALSRAYNWAGRYAEAIAVLKTQLLRDPQSGPRSMWSYLALANAYREQWAAQLSQDPETLAQALAAVQRAIGILDTASDNHSALGYVYLWQQQYEPALAAMERAIALEPNEARNAVSNYAGLAEVLSRMGRAEEALGAAEQALRLQPATGGVDAHLASVGKAYAVAGRDRKSTRLNSSHLKLSRMPSSA